MMRWLISDTHFGHKNIVKFDDGYGNKLRPWNTIDEHDEALVEMWNAKVHPRDTVYHLGDFCMPRTSLSIAERLNGRIILIRGNHDTFKKEEYSGFHNVHGALVKDKMILTHIPIHPDSLSRWAANVHGHLHHNTIKDDRYINVSCEQIGFAPISYDEIIERVKGWSK